MIDFSIVAARHLLLFYALHYPEAQTKKTGRTVTKKTQQFHLKLMICLPLKLNTDKSNSASKSLMSVFKHS